MSARVFGLPSKVWLALGAAAFAIAACGGSAGVASTSGAAAAPATGGGSPTEATPVATDSYTTNIQSSALVPLPTNTVDWQKGKVFKVGDAIKDPTSGLIFQVTDVHRDGSLGGLSAGQTWVLADITIGDDGTQPMSVSPAGDFGYCDANGNDAGFGLNVLAAMTNNVITSDNQFNADIQPGTATHGLLPMAGPADATGLVLYFYPVGITTDSPFMVSVGP
jgi:hypothetical protein